MEDPGTDAAFAATSAFEHTNTVCSPQPQDITAFAQKRVQACPSCVLRAWVSLVSSERDERDGEVQLPTELLKGPKREGDGEEGNQGMIDLR